MFAAAKRSTSQRFGRLMIDTVVQIVVGKCVRDSGKMDDGIALLQ